MKLAFGYIRRSSYKQQENNSVEIQKQHIQEFAKRNQFYIPDEFLFIEDVTSAYSRRADQRKELMKLGEKMIQMNVPVAIFYDVSRMDRTGYSFTKDFYRPMLEKLPYLKVYTTQSNDPINPEDLTMKMNFLLFQHESEVKSERALGVLMAALEQETPKRPGSKIPYGYSQIDKQLIPNENAEIVSFIFYLYSWGQSFKKIAFLLNEASILSPNGKQWRSSTLENIIKNPVYTGNLTWHMPKRKEGQKLFTFEKTHDPIINSFHLNFHQQNKSLQKKYGRFDTPFLFLNKIKCRECHQTLETQNGSTTRNGTNYLYQYYVCKDCQYKTSIQEVHEQFVPLILKRVHQFISTDQAKRQTLEFLSLMTRDIDEIVLSTVTLIDQLTNKLVVAKELGDRELELHIASFLQLHQDSLRVQRHCQENLIQSIQSVESNQFFSRFQDILAYQLGETEKRLIILYFIDYIQLSPDHPAQIQYKSNIFDDLGSSGNG